MPRKIRAQRPKKEDEAWEIDFTGWKQKDKNAYLKAIALSETEGDEEPQYPFLAEIVTRWPFEGDPGEVSSYGELDMLDFRKVQTKVLEAFQRYFN